MSRKTFLESGVVANTMHSRCKICNDKKKKFAGKDGKLCQPAHRSVKHDGAILFCPEPLRTQQNWTDSGHQSLG